MTPATKRRSHTEHQCALRAEHLDMLRHMLGINVADRRNPPEYRNYACTNPGDATMRALQAAGMVLKYRIGNGYEWWTATDAGIAAARASQRAMLKPKAARVYARFLDVSDALPDLTFKRFLTSPEFAETRRDA